MGTCNGYHYHDLRPEDKQPKPLVWVPPYPEREADERMLAEIAAAPEDEEAREMY